MSYYGNNLLLETYISQELGQCSTARQFCDHPQNILIRRTFKKKKKMKSTFAIILVSSISLIGQAIAQSCQTYTVQSGDYCYKIASQFGINPWNLLLQWNPSLDSNCDIYVGQVLCVSAGGSSPTP